MIWYGEIFTHLVKLIMCTLCEFCNLAARLKNETDEPYTMHIYWHKPYSKFLIVISQCRIMYTVYLFTLIQTDNMDNNQITEKWKAAKQRKYMADWHRNRKTNIEIRRENINCFNFNFYMNSIWVALSAIQKVH